MLQPLFFFFIYFYLLLLPLLETFHPPRKIFWLQISSKGRSKLGCQARVPLFERKMLSTTFDRSWQLNAGRTSGKSRVWRQERRIIHPLLFPEIDLYTYIGIKEALYAADSLVCVWWPQKMVISPSTALRSTINGKISSLGIFCLHRDFVLFLSHFTETHARRKHFYMPATLSISFEIFCGLARRYAAYSARTTLSTGKCFPLLFLFSAVETFWWCVCAAAL